MTELRAEGLVVRAADATLLNITSIRLQAGELVAILGPNGAGKTTLLRALLGMNKTAAGTAEIDGRDISNFSASERARSVSYLPQQRPLAWPNTVFDVVSLGRFAHGATLGRLSAKDAEAVETAIVSCDLQHLARREVDTLSGGELARVHLARAFATRAPLLIADEPLAELDPRHQWRIAELLKSFVADGGGALAVLHEVAIASRVADRLIWMKSGEIVSEGTPVETLSAERLQEVYGVRGTVTSTERGLDVRIEGVS
ncbi:MAG: ABC transporter ATP-binding protein [Acidobacteriota bacterium]